MTEVLDFYTETGGMTPREIGEKLAHVPAVNDEEKLLSMLAPHRLRLTSLTDGSIYGESDCSHGDVIRIRIETVDGQLLSIKDTTAGLTGQFRADFNDVEIVNDFALLCVEAETLTDRIWNRKAHAVFQCNGESPEHRFVSSSGSGSGNSRDTPASVDYLADLVDSMTGGGTVVFMNDGDYDCLEYVHNPAHSSLICFKGDEGIVRIIGDRTDWTLPDDAEQVTDVSSWNRGYQNNITFSKGNFVISDFEFKNCGGDEAVFSTYSIVRGIKLQNVNGYNVRRLMSHTSSLERAFEYVDIRNVTVTGYSKNCFRFRGYSRFITIMSFDLNSGRQDQDNFAAGVQIGQSGGSDTKYVHLYDGAAYNCHSSVGSYWNGDGVISERDNDHLYLENVSLHGHTDGGIDFKSEHTVLFDCSIHDNKRNLRSWGGLTSPCIIVNCEIGSANRRGGSGDSLWVWFNGTDSDNAETNAEMLVIRSSFSGISNNGFSAGDNDSGRYNSYIRLIECNLDDSQIQSDLYSLSGNSKVFYSDNYSSVFAGDVHESARITLSDFDFYEKIELSDNCTSQLTWSSAPSAMMKNNSDLLFPTQHPGMNYVSEIMLRDKNYNSKLVRIPTTIISNPVGENVRLHITPSGTVGTTDLVDDTTLNSFENIGMPEERELPSGNGETGLYCDNDNYIVVPKKEYLNIVGEKFTTTIEAVFNSFPNSGGGLIFRIGPVSLSIHNDSNTMRVQWIADGGNSYGDRMNVPRPPTGVPVEIRLENNGGRFRLYQDGQMISSYGWGSSSLKDVDLDISFGRTNNGMYFKRIEHRIGVVLTDSDDGYTV